MSKPNKPDHEYENRLDDFTWFVHQQAKQAPLFESGSLGSLPYSLMPAVGIVVKDFAVELLEWFNNQDVKGEHACLTGDCPHQTQIECWRKLAEDCMADLRVGAQKHG